MFRKVQLARRAVFIIVLGCAMLRGQQPPPMPNSSGPTDFPAIMRQNVVAGATPRGTKIQAKLVIATLVDGVVIPREAVLSGEITESVAKSGNEPSRLAIRMNSAVWKNGSVSIQAYLTGWYYPPEPIEEPSLSDQPIAAAQSPKTWNGAGTYADPNNPASRPFPGRDPDPGPAITWPASSIPKRRLVIKNVDVTNHADGAITLTSAHSNIKLDKVTTYVLSTGAPAAVN